MQLFLLFVCIFTVFKRYDCSPQAQQLYAHLFEDRQVITSIRPIKNHRDTVILFMNLSLLQIMEVNVKNQYLMLNVMIQQEWIDPQFIWEPKLFGNESQLYVPSDQVWRPDLTLYNNGGSDWDLGGASGTKITINHDGRMVWKPPMILLSQCTMNVKYFPFDVQSCTLKLGTWTSNGLLIDLRHYAQKRKAISKLKPVYDNCESEINYAIDLENYRASGEWDILEVSAKRNIAKYSCCPEPYIDVTFNIRIKRKTLFYGVNLICPVICISFLTMLVFYLPTDPCEKMTLSVSVFIASVVFLIVIFDLSPPTSLVVPLIVKYLLFALVMVFLSINVSILVLKVSYDKSPISPRVRKIFLDVLPRLLVLKYPKKDKTEETELFNKFSNMCNNDEVWRRWQNQNIKEPRTPMEEIESALMGIRSITNHIKEESEAFELTNDWNSISIVIDRFFMYLLSLVTAIATIWIFTMAPSISNTESILTGDIASDLLHNQTVTTLGCK